MKTPPPFDLCRCPNIPPVSFPVHNDHPKVSTHCVSNSFRYEKNGMSIVLLCYEGVCKYKKLVNDETGLHGKRSKENVRQREGHQKTSKTRSETTLVIFVTFWSAGVCFPSLSTNQPGDLVTGFRIVPETDSDKNVHSCRKERKD